MSVLKRGLRAVPRNNSIGTRVLGAVGMAAILTVTAVPVSASPSQHSDDGKERFLVVLHNSASPTTVAEEHRRRHGADISHVYQDALKGYAAELPAQAAQAIARDSRVAFIERDQTVEVASQEVPTGIKRVFAPANPTIDIDGTDDIRVDVDVAIIDTGIDLDHPDLNVVSSIDCTLGSTLRICAEGGDDDHGHGTHVAGTAAAVDNGIGVVGVAPGSRLHAVKVLSATGAGLISWIVAGVDWVTAHADTIEVANMSLACRCTSTALDIALAASVDSGVVHVVAAGNSDEEARWHTPASHPDVITVSALADFDGQAGASATPTCRTDEDDTLANFSNWGGLVEVAAPGVCISSTWLLGGYQTMSGTSMASPQVAGAAAILTSGANDPHGRNEVMAVHDAIIGSGNLGWIDDSGDGIHERLLDVGNAEIFVVNNPTRTLGTTEATNQPPAATFAFDCTNLTCHFDASESSDPDGAISSYAWDFGDGTMAAGTTVDKTYDQPDSYIVVLTVTDDQGATGTVSRTVTLDSTGGPRVSLNAAGVRMGAEATVYLDWSGTDRAGNIVVYRNGVAIATTPDDGSYTDVIENASGTYTYKVCEADTQNCSNEATLQF